MFIFTTLSRRMPNTGCRMPDAFECDAALHRHPQKHLSQTWCQKRQRPSEESLCVQTIEIYLSSCFGWLSNPGSNQGPTDKQSDGGVFSGVDR